MPYIKDTLISRAPAGPLGALGSFLDTIKDVAKGTLTFYGEQQKQAGALEAQTAALAARQPAPSSGISTETVVIGGLALAGVAAILLTRKRRG
jgi:LPXTG-motif cell wall-anchored protein